MSPQTVAVVTRTRDRPSFLARALASVRGQTFEDWHHVVVNDGGAPGPVDALVDSGPTADVKRTSVVHLSSPSGRGRAANVGLARSASRFVVFHDDDDTWQPTFLERAVDELSRHRVRGVVFASARVLERFDGVRFEEVSRAVWRSDLQAVSLAECAKENCFTNLSFLAERGAIEAVGGYDETLPVYEDWDFNLRFLSRFDVRWIPEVLASYHARVAGQGAARSSFEAAGGDAANARAAIVNRWLRDPATAHIGLIMALGPSLDAISAMRTRLDKAFNLLHRVRHAWPFGRDVRSES